jgi:hypothetical protein
MDDVKVQKILRHKDVQVTRDHYIKTSDDQSVAAMAKVGSAWGEFCADYALLAYRQRRLCRVSPSFG